MLTKRIIPCLDVKDGRTVKGVNFINLVDAGDPVELAKRYSEEGADELVFLDISATQEKRKTLADLASAVGSQLDIPFTIGGGISSPADVEVLLDSGADKVSVNSAAVKNPKILDELSKCFGAQCIVIAIDAKLIDGDWIVHVAGGTKRTDKNLFDWAKEATDRGAGEILFTSMDHDGSKSGFAVEALKNLHEQVTVPIIASGGAGYKWHFVDVFEKGKADAALAASIFHFGEISVPELKTYLADHNIPIRL